MAKLDPRLQDVVRSQPPFARFVVVAMVTALEKIGGPNLVEKAIADFISDGPGSSPDMTERVPGTNRTLGDYNGLSAGQMLVIHDDPKTVAKVAAMFAERGMSIGVDDVPPEKREALDDALSDHQGPDPVAEEGEEPRTNIVRNLRETLSGKADWRKRKAGSVSGWKVGERLGDYWDRAGIRESARRGDPNQVRSDPSGKETPLDPVGDPNALKTSPGTGQTMTPIPAVVGQSGVAIVGDPTAPAGPAAGAADDDDHDEDDDDAPGDAPADVVFAGRPLKDYAGKSRDQILSMNVPPRVASKIVAALAKLPPADAGK